MFKKVKRFIALVVCINSISISLVSIQVKADTISPMYKCDINKDNVINFSDLMQIITHFNQNYNDPNFDPSCDLNSDGSINMSDVVILANYFNRIITNSDGSPIATPTSLPIHTWF
jgi:hypothetical protein